MRIGKGTWKDHKAKKGWNQIELHNQWIKAADWVFKRVDHTIEVKISLNRHYILRTTIKEHWLA